MCPPTQEKRELQLQQLQDVLYSAWDALGITEGAAERAALAPLFVAPERLHLSIKDRVSVAAVLPCVGCLICAMKWGCLPAQRWQISDTHTLCVSGAPLLRLPQAFAEVCRLEECETAKMKELALIKARQLQAECAATHITVPKCVSA